MNEKKNIAILYFSRTAAQEIQNKDWSLESRRALSLANVLIDRTRVFLESTGLPVFHSHEGNQVGNTFGAKLSNAFDSLFESGFDAVISIGNDSPELDRINWDTIIKDLVQGKCVMGPSIRGGAYLIGLTRESFRYNEFQALSWQSSLLSDSLQKYFLHQGQEVRILEKLRDLNTIFDLKNARINSSEIGKIILLLLRMLPPFKTDSIPVKKNHCILKELLRAPPHFT